jgi:hypothetical protein
VVVGSLWFPYIGTVLQYGVLWTAARSRAHRHTRSEQPSP